MEFAPDLEALTTADANTVRQLISPHWVREMRLQLRPPEIDPVPAVLPWECNRCGRKYLRQRGWAIRHRERNDCVSGRRRQSANDRPLSPPVVASPPTTSVVARRRRGTWQSVTLRHHLRTEREVLCRTFRGCTRGCGNVSRPASPMPTCPRCLFLSWMSSAQDNLGWHTIVYGHQDDTAANRRRVSKWSPPQDLWSP